MSSLDMASDVLTVSGLTVFMGDAISNVRKYITLLTRGVITEAEMEAAKGKMREKRGKRGFGRQG